MFETKTVVLLNIFVETRDTLPFKSKKWILVFKSDSSSSLQYLYSIVFIHNTFLRKAVSEYV